MKRLVLLALPLALLAASCGSDDGGVPTDHAWQLTQIVDTSKPADYYLLALETVPTLVFEDDQAAGNASCNRYFGSYDLDGSSITLGPLASTQMFCTDPGVMEQESAYLAALESVDAWSMDDETLMLSSGGAPVLRYEAITQDLAGTSWDLVAYNNGTGGFQSVWGDEAVSAAFGEDGTLSGSAGCNGYTASWKTEDGSIEIGTAASTLMACADEQLMAQEARYLELLNLADTYRVDVGMLEMFDADGTRILQYLVSVG